MYRNCGFEKRSSIIDLNSKISKKILHNNQGPTFGLICFVFISHLIIQCNKPKCTRFFFPLRERHGLVINAILNFGCMQCDNVLHICFPIYKCIPFSCYQVRSNVYFIDITVSLWLQDHMDVSCTCRYRLNLYEKTCKIDQWRKPQNRDNRGEQKQIQTLPNIALVHPRLERKRISFITYFIGTIQKSKSIRISSATTS